MTIILVAVSLAGLSIALYPGLRGAVMDSEIQKDAAEFLEWVETVPTAPVVTVPVSREPDDILPAETVHQEKVPAETRPYQQLWENMTKYNEAIYEAGQAGLSDESAYEDPSFILADYGLGNEIFGVISIPKLELEMPIYLGATYQHMADGAAHLTQTSLPIDGDNTNCVIAGHRGWGGAAYFRYVTELKPGDEVIITNLWETLTYHVADTQIIWPYEVDQILIQEGRELLTLLTCHPYASGGKQRYLVICERAE